MPYRSFVETNKTNKISLLLIKIIVLFVFLIVLALGYFATTFYVQNYKETYLCDYSSEDSSYKLEVVELGTIKETYGPTNCEFKLYKDDECVNKFKFIVLDDGNIPDEDNFAVEWQSDKVKIIVSGEDQLDKMYFMNYEK